MSAALQYPPFGRDLSCTDRILPNRLVTGTRLLAEAQYRRLTTERGSLENDPHYGFNLTAWLGKATDADDLIALPGLITSELMKDERIGSVEIGIVRTVVAGTSIALTITIHSITKEGVAFKLVLAASDVTTDILELQEAA